MNADEIRSMVETIKAQGRSLMGPPTPRQDLLARMIDPGAWSTGAQEHVDWAARHNRLDPSLSFGGQYVGRRLIAMAEAQRMVDALDRQARGEPEDEYIDVRTLGDRLRKEGEHDGQYRLPRTRAINGMMMNYRLNGLRMPEVVDDDECITLTWTLQHGRASMRFDGDGKVTGELSPFRPDFEPWTVSVHSRELPRLVPDLLRQRSDVGMEVDAGLEPVAA